MQDGETIVGGVLCHETEGGHTEYTAAELTELLLRAREALADVGDVQWLDETICGG